MKTLIYFFLPLITIVVQGQVGINNTEPKATLDVTVNPALPLKPEGIIAPRLKGSELKSRDTLYTDDQKGAFVHVIQGLAMTDTTAKTVEVTKEGYYYFDGEKWKPFDWNTLETVTNRGNYSSRYITFSGSTANPTRDGALGMNLQTYSMFFGNMNPIHTGVYNLSYGYGALQNITTATGNVAMGSYSLNGVTTGAYNTFIGHYSGYDYSDTDKIITGNVNIGLGNSIFSKLTSGYKNIAIGQSALHSLNTGSYNTIIGQSSGQSITSESKNVMLGAQTGVYVKGENNVFIGTGAGHSNTGTTIETVNNRLVIHSNASLVPSESIGTENTVDLSASWTNGLIIGDFVQRWLKINGRFMVNPSYPTSDVTYTKNVIAKPDGTFGFEDKFSIPKPPENGTYILKSIDGNLQWSNP